MAGCRLARRDATARILTIEIIAHRPRHARGLADIEEAIASGADRVELDVLALDGELVVAHDEREARHGMAPAFHDALCLIVAARRGLLADLKDPAAAPALGRVLLAAGKETNTVISGELVAVGVAAASTKATRAWTLPTGRRAHPGAAPGPLGLATPAARRRAGIAAKLALGSGRCDAVCVDRRFVDAALASTVHATGGRLLVWTVDRPAQLRRLARLGADGVITRDVRAARRVLGR